MNASVLTGRNGAGKTTLLRLLLNEYKPDAGEIILDFRHACIAYLAQDIPDLKGTVAESGADGAAHHAAEGDWKVEMEAEHWIALAGLQPELPFRLSFRRTKTAHTSGPRPGVSDPDALLLDEPDQPSRHQFHRLDGGCVAHLAQGLIVHHP